MPKAAKTGNEVVVNKPAKAPRRSNKFVAASAGPYTRVDENTGNIITDPLTSRIMAAKHQARSGDVMAKTAGLFSDGEIGPANIADSNNIGMYSYEFPVDAMELPASRAEELRFYRLAVDRDPIVGHGIDLHATIPVSKMNLEQPKCSVDEFSEYIFDFFQRLMNDTQFFAFCGEAVREYMQIGEAFLWVEEDDIKIEYSKEAREALEKGRGSMAGMAPMSEAENEPLGGSEANLTHDFVSSRKAGATKEDKEPTKNYISLKSKRSFLQKRAKKAGLTEKFLNAGIVLSPEDKVEDIEEEIENQSRELAKLVRASKGITKKASITKKADPAPAPEAPPAGGDAGPIDATPGDTPPDTLTPDGEPVGEDSLGDIGGGAPMGGGGGGGFGGGGGGDMGMGGSPDTIGGAIDAGQDAEHRRRMSDLKRYLHLLEKQKELLEELNDVVEKKNLQKELFSHVMNEEYQGFSRIQILPPEQIDITNDGQGGQGAAIHYKPSAEEQEGYLEDSTIAPEVRDALEEHGTIELNQNPYLGSYVIHFARKKAGYELHGRSILQRCIRCIIYREKLRQVQTTLASRNMTPKTLLVAPGVSAAQVAELRAHADEAKADPDYTIVTNYAVTWEEIGSGGRLLALADEWSHTNSDLAIGLGFSPEILIGEGLYSGNRVQLEIMSVVYLQLRTTLSDIIENKLFKPIAIKKGFFEMDNYGRPRWIYPKISFGRLALRDSGDLYDMLLNLYTKGSLPISVLYEQLDLDPETMKKGLEEDLFTVNDSKFGNGLDTLYNSIGETILNKTDLFSRLAQSMTLKETPQNEDDGMEGSGDGL